MLIYCSHLWILPTCSGERLTQSIAKWLAQKTRGKIAASDLVDGYKRRFAPDYLVEVAEAETGEGLLAAVRLRHSDVVVPGRDWLADVGIRRREDSVLCSVTLATHETSRFVPAVAETTRPRIVADIADSCPLDSATIGGSPRALTLDDAEAFDYRVKDPDRTFPIIVISCDHDGRCLVDPNRVASLLLGLAEVVVIPPGVDTFRLQDVLTEQYSAYGGAITFIWRRTRFGGRDVVPSTKLIPERLLELQARTTSLESEILAKVCHRTNATFALEALTLDDVRRAGSQALLDRALAHGGANAAELKSLYESVDVEQREQIKALELDLARKHEECDQVRDDLEEGRRANDALKQHLDAAGTARPSAQPTPPDRSLLLACMTDEPTLERCLDVIEMLFADRVVILSSARSSAREAAEFKHSRRALLLLWKLCDQYWTMLCSGKGNNEAKDVLGSAFAANESESARNNKQAKALRTFPYEGQSVEMMQHLKIGVKPDSLAETWRAHFHWDAKRRRIVIGHCGRHLDHN